MRREEKIIVNLFVDLWIDPSLLEGSISMDFGLGKLGVSSDVERRIYDRIGGT